MVVFPAPAGMNRELQARGASTGSVPRASGDEEISFAPTLTSEALRVVMHKVVVNLVPVLLI